MPLTGSLLERTHRAIIDTFRRHELDQFVRIQLEEKLEAIARDDNLSVQAYELLLWANRHGREQELLDHLVAERPNKDDFATIAEVLRTSELLVPPAGQYARLPGRGPMPLYKPMRVQHFTGREQDLAKLLADLQPGKILTLCGPGGIGKSALAAEAVWRLAPGGEPPERFPDGVIFHSFYHQPQADLALEAFAHAYGLDSHPSPRDAARQALTGRRALLILDGAEATDDLEAVLSVTDSCGVLVTTRRRDDAHDDGQEIAPLSRAESIELLRAWGGKFTPDDGVTDEIVDLLGGLPLALFLGGRYLAQRRQHTGEFVAWLHEQGLAALHFGNRPHKSIPLLMQSSLAQVSERARAAFGVAGVLAFAAFPADIVSYALKFSPATASNALGELVGYGLLLRPGDNYHVTHALAHNYARTQAAPDDEIINRLAMYYAELVELESAKGLVGYAALNDQRAHIVAVQAAALKAEQWEAVRQVTWKVDHYLDLLGYSTDRLMVIQAGLAAARASGARHDEAEFLNRLGNTYYALGEPRQAIGLYEHALAIAREIGDQRGEAIALGNLGNGYFLRYDTRRAVRLYEQALIIMRDIGDRRGEGNTLGSLGQAYADLDETRRAIELYEQTLVIMCEIGDLRAQGSVLDRMGQAYAALGETRRALELHEQGLQIARELGDRRGEGNALCHLGKVHYILGETRRAIELCEQGLRIAREIGDRRGEAFACRCLGLAHEREGDLARAVANLQVIVAYEHEIGHPDATVDARQLADLRTRSGL
ncbi:MAG: tetratricopeptide repeat protein [Caldilineaceae bacterium]